MDLFTFAEKQNQLRAAEQLRDQGIERVTRSNWMLEAVETLQRHREELPSLFIGEDIRELILCYIEAPHHPNAWGALTRYLVVLKMIVQTGRIVKMRTPSSHARRSPEYRLQ